MRLNPKSCTCVPGYGDFTLGGTELQKLKSLRILGVTFDCKLTFETYLREFVSKTAGSLCVVRLAGFI